MRTVQRDAQASGWSSESDSVRCALPAAPARAVGANGELSRNRRPGAPPSRPGAPPFRRRAAAALLLACAACLAAPLPAQAQTTLVSNLGRTTFVPEVLQSLLEDHSQTFTTGSNAQGYGLSTIEIDFTVVPTSGSPDVSLWSTTSDGKPSSKLVDFTNPATVSRGANAFAAPPGTVLTRDTRYAVVIEAWGNGRIKSTYRTDEDSGGLSDWSIAGKLWWRPSGFSWAATNDQKPWALKIRAKGSVLGGTDHDATLSALSLEDGGGNTVALVPAFVATTGSYRAIVASSVDSLTLTATKNDADATVVITDDDDASTANTATFSLALGVNPLTVTVTAKDGNTTATYAVSVTRWVSTPPVLSKAVVHGTALGLTYDMALDEGSVPPPSAFSVSVNGGAGTAPSSVSVSGEEVTLALASAVTAGQAVTVSYTVPTGAGAQPIRNSRSDPAATLTDQAVSHLSDLATLSAFSFTGDTAVDSLSFAFDPAFDPDVTEYMVDVPIGINEHPLSGYKVIFSRTDEDATVTVTDHSGVSTLGPEVEAHVDNLVPGTNTIELEVTATGAGATIFTTYTITVTRGVGLRGSLQGVPGSHDGSTAFELTLEFALDITATTTRLGQAIAITNGTLSGLAAVDGSQRHFTMTVTPSSAAPLGIHVQGTDSCEQGQFAHPVICTASGKAFRGIRRWVSTADDAQLRALWLLDKNDRWVERSQEFTPGVTGYAVEVDHSHEELTLFAVPYTSAATVEIGGPAGTFTATDRGDGGQRAALDVPLGTTTWTATVTSADGNETKSYTMTVDRGDPPPTRSRHCREEVFDSVTVTPVGSGTLRSLRPVGCWSYVASLSTDTTAVTVDAVTLNPDVSVTIHSHQPAVAGYFALPRQLSVDTGEELYLAALLEAEGPDQHYQIFVDRGATSGATEAEPLVAALTDVPESHDGASAFTLRLAFSDDVDVDGEGLRAALLVTGGTLAAVQPVDGRADLWELTVEPDGDGAVGILVPLTTDCDAAGALCTEDGRTLLVGVARSIAGPPSGRPVSPLTGSFESVPESHDGSAEFTVELTFNAELAPNSRARLLGHALTVTDGTVEDVRRLAGAKRDQWRIRVRPAGQGTVRLSLATAGECGSEGAVCTEDGRALSNTPSTSVAGPPPLTASFRQVPEAHDGSTEFTLEIAFSEALPSGGSRGRVERSLAVTGGQATRVRRVDERRDLFRIHVRPAGDGAVTVRLPQTADCDAADALCTAGGRALSNTPSTAVAGPPGLAVADAEVEEGASAVLAFAVTLSRAASGAVTVAYATANGTATAGEDYTAASGTLTFAAGETARTVSVPVLDDAHDEGSETLTLTLSSPSGAYLEDGSATGTITNSDPLPKAWLARFGRTAAVHVVEQVEERMAAPREPGFEGRFAGRQLRRGAEQDIALGFLRQLGASGGMYAPGGMHAPGGGMYLPGGGMHGPGSAMHGPGGGFGGSLTGAPMGMGAGGMGMAGLPMGMGAGGMGMAGAPMGRSMAGATGMGGAPMSAATGATGMAGGMGRPAAGARGMAGAPPGGARAGDPAGRGWLSQGLGGRSALAGSALSLNRQTRRGGVLSFWSRGAQSSFFGRDGALGLDGDVRTATVGADYAQGPLVMGLSLAHIRGSGGYDGLAEGRLEASLTGLYPWLGYRVSERVSVWGVTGAGGGGLLLAPEGGAPLHSGLSMKMAAAGTRGELIAGGANGFGLAFKADALWVGTASGAVDGPTGRLAATSAAVSRLRTALEGSRGFTLRGRLSLAPAVEVGLRHDAGDAERGAGIDVAGRVVVADAATGLAVEMQVRMLLVHEAAGYRERGAAVSLRYDPTPRTPLGLTARVAPSWGGRAAGGADALWGRQTMAGLGHGRGAGGNGLAADLGYGLPVGSRFIGTPRVGFESREHGRGYRLGYGIATLAEGTTFELGVDAQRQESPTRGGTSSSVLGRATVGW